MTEQNEVQYSSGRKQEVSFRSGDATLSGTLYLPDGSPPYPAVVMLQGSGPTNRDSEGYFPPIRDRFLCHGIAVFSYDKPGIGDSSGDWRHRTLSDRADEALDAVTFLQSHGAIAPERIGLWGHSQGGWVVPLAASRATSVAFAIASSGPGISPPKQDCYAVEQTMRADGCPEEQIAQVMDYLATIQEAARRSDPYEQVERSLLHAARAEPWYRYFTVDDADEWQFFCAGSRNPYEPGSALECVTCPILAVFGGRDVLVPVPESVAIFDRSLQKAGNADSTIVVFPQANHRLLIADHHTSSPDQAPFAPGYLDLMMQWTTQRVHQTKQ